jgi:hypothetical protein
MLDKYKAMLDKQMHNYNALASLHDEAMELLDEATKRAKGFLQLYEHEAKRRQETEIELFRVSKLLKIQMENYKIISLN